MAKLHERLQCKLATTDIERAEKDSVPSAIGRATLRLSMPVRSEQRPKQKQNSRKRKQVKRRLESPSASSSISSVIVVTPTCRPSDQQPSGAQSSGQVQGDCKQPYLNGEADKSTGPIDHAAPKKQAHAVAAASDMALASVPPLLPEPVAAHYIAAHPEPEVRARRQARLEGWRQHARQSRKDKARAAEKQWRQTLLAHKDDNSEEWATFKWMYNRPEDMNLWGDNHQSKINSPPADGTDTEVVGKAAVVQRPRRDSTRGKDGGAGRLGKRKRVEGRVELDSFDGVKEEEYESNASPLWWHGSESGSEVEGSHGKLSTKRCKTITKEHMAMSGQAP